MNPTYMKSFKAGAAVRLATDSGKTGFRGTVMDLIKDETSVQEAEERFLGRSALPADLRLCFRLCPALYKDRNAASGLTGRKDGLRLRACGLCLQDQNLLTEHTEKVCKDGPVFPGNEVGLRCLI